MMYHKKFHRKLFIINNVIIIVTFNIIITFVFIIIVAAGVIKIYLH